MAVIVITGGTAGVGKATALHFAKAGYDVGLIARDEASLHSTQEELRRFGVNAHAVQADVADSQAVTGRRILSRRCKRQSSGQASRWYTAMRRI